MKKLSSDTFINVAAAFCLIPIMLISVPLYIGGMGQERFGVVSVTSLFIGYLGLSDLGLGRALTNRLVRDAGERDHVLFWSAIALNTLFSAVLVGLITIYADSLFLNWLKLPPELRDECTNLPLFLSVGAAATSFNTILNGVFEARRRFFQVNMLYISGVLGTQLVPAVYAYFVTPSLAHIIPLSVTMRVLATGVSAGIVISKGGVGKGAVPRLPEMRDLFHYGSVLSVTTLIGGLMGNVDQFIIARQLGIGIVPFFAIPLGLVTKLNIIPYSFMRAAFPVLSRQVDCRQNLEREGLQLLLPVMTALCSFGMVLMDPFLTIWLGRTFSDGAAPIGIFMLAGIWHSGNSYVPMASLEARNRAGVVAKLNLVLVFPYVLGQVWVVYHFGLTAAALLWAVRYALQFAVLICVSRYVASDLRTIGISFLVVSTSCVLALAKMALFVNLALGGVFLAGGTLWFALVLQNQRRKRVQTLSPKSM